jgi:3-hydroxyisobutyrate dehydrogenase
MQHLPSSSPVSIETVGIVGLGNIGRGIALAISRGGKPTLVWDSAEPARNSFSEIANVSVAAPGEMAKRAQIILFVVPSTKQIRECLRGNDGIFANAQKGLVIYDLTTSDPSESRKVAKEANKHGIFYLDAGTSGGPYKADKGQLLTMIGGDRDAFERSRHVLNNICEHVFYVGPSGAGHTLKLLHNIVCHATTLATAEAGHMAERAGISLKDMIDVFNVSNARSYATEFRFPKHIISKTWDGRSRIFNLHKDIQMGVALGERLDADTTFSEATLKILNLAMAHGMSEDDHTLLYRDFDKFRDKAKRTVKEAKKTPIRPAKKKTNKTKVRTTRHAARSKKRR